MRRVCYQVAMSLDGYIAGPQGEFDWIPDDPEIDFAPVLRRFDTLLMGRKTYQVAAQSGHAQMPGMKTIVVSETLRQEEDYGITVLHSVARDYFAELKAMPGKDIWLFGGGSLFRSLAAEGLVDAVEVAIMPVLLGSGIPLIAPPIDRIKLALSGHRIYKSGIVMLEYNVAGDKRV